MTQPQYYWQKSDIRGIPLIDIPEEEFDQRLEEMIEHLECVEQVEAAAELFMRR